MKPEYSLSLAAAENFFATYIHDVLKVREISLYFEV